MEETQDRFLINVDDHHDTKKGWGFQEMTTQPHLLLSLHKQIECFLLLHTQKQLRGCSEQCPSPVCMQNSCLHCTSTQFRTISNWCCFCTVPTCCCCQHTHAASIQTPTSQIKLSGFSFFTKRHSAAKKFLCALRQSPLSKHGNLHRKLHMRHFMQKQWSSP